MLMFNTAPARVNACNIFHSDPVMVTALNNPSVVENNNMVTK